MTITGPLDAVDRAFLWHAERSRQASLVQPLPKRLPPAAVAVARERAVPEPAPPRLTVTAPRERSLPAARSDAAPSAATGAEAGAEAGAANAPLVDRLLQAVPRVWAHLARRVEESRCDGAEVIAITGAQRHAGRTTVVRCLERTLVARGWRVDCHDRPPLPMDREVSARAGGRESRIVLVDAGVWFPSGPLRRAWLERQSLGCHAVILVRRADQPACEARGTLLESVGLKVLGEVLTMSPPAVGGVSVG